MAWESPRTPTPSASSQAPARSSPAMAPGTGRTGEPPAGSGRRCRHSAWITTSRTYPAAGHAFLNDHDSAGDRNPVIFIVMGKFAGPSGYHHPIAHDARRRILAFFRAHLK